jgi:hypothetical protein
MVTVAHGKPETNYCPSTLTLTTSPGSHSAITWNGRQQTSQSVVKHCSAMLVSMAQSKFWPQKGHVMVTETSISVDNWGLQTPARMLYSKIYSSKRAAAMNPSAAGSVESMYEKDTTSFSYNVRARHGFTGRGGHWCRPAPARGGCFGRRSGSDHCASAILCPARVRGASRRSGRPAGGWHWFWVGTLLVRARVVWLWWPRMVWRSRVAWRTGMVRRPWVERPWARALNERRSEGRPCDV